MKNVLPMRNQDLEIPMHSDVAWVCKEVVEDEHCRY